MSDIVKIVVVYNKKTKRIIPFKYGEKGDIIVANGYNTDDLVVSKISVDKLDLDLGYVLEDNNG